MKNQDTKLRLFSVSYNILSFQILYLDEWSICYVSCFPNVYVIFSTTTVSQFLFKKG